MASAGAVFPVAKGLHAATLSHYVNFDLVCAIQALAGLSTEPTLSRLCNPPDIVHGIAKTCHLIPMRS